MLVTRRGSFRNHGSRSLIAQEINFVYYSPTTEVVSFNITNVQDIQQSEVAHDYQFQISLEELIAMTNAVAKYGCTTRKARERVVRLLPSLLDAARAIADVNLKHS